MGDQQPLSSLRIFGDTALNVTGDLTTAIQHFEDELERAGIALDIAQQRHTNAFNQNLTIELPDNMSADLLTRIVRAMEAVYERTFGTLSPPRTEAQIPPTVAFQVDDRRFAFPEERAAAIEHLRREREGA